MWGNERRADFAKRRKVGMLRRLHGDIYTDVAAPCLLPAVLTKYNISDVRYLYCDRPDYPPKLFTRINTTFRTVLGKRVVYVELQSRRNERVASHRVDDGKVAGKFPS